MSFVSALEPLRAANELSGQRLYEWFLVSTGKAIVASNGLSVTADHSIAGRSRYDTVLVRAGGNPSLFDDARAFAWLRRQARSGGIAALGSDEPLFLQKLEV
jgi:transcriptional regulator GlxA family with amidase domain